MYSIKSLVITVLCYHTTFISYQKVKVFILLTKINSLVDEYEYLSILLNLYLKMISAMHSKLKSDFCMHLNSKS